MALIVAINLIVVGILVAITIRKGLEYAFPFATFCLVFLPRECQFTIPGLFDISTYRIIIGTLAVLYIAGPKKSSKQSALETLPLKALILVQVAWCLISTADSIVQTASIKKLLSVIFEYYILYYVVFKTISRVQTIHKILFGLVFAILTCSVLGTVEAYTTWRAVQWFPQTVSRISLEIADRGMAMDRIQSTFPHSILYGAGLAGAIPIALYLLSVAKSIRMKGLLWLALVAMFLNIYKTNSRGAWLGLMISLLLLLLLGGRPVRKCITVIGALCIMVFVVRPGVWDSVSTTYSTTLDPTSVRGEAYEYRYVLREVAQKALGREFKRCIWGYGMESFFDLHLEGELNGRRKLFWSCDSSWIEFAVETGYIGLFLTASLLLLPAVRAWKCFRIQPSPGRYLSLTFFAWMAIYYFMMISVDLYAWGQNGYMLWIIIALSLAYGRIQQSHSDDDKVEPSAAAQNYIYFEPTRTTSYLTSAMLRFWGGLSATPMLNSNAPRSQVPSAPRTLPSMSVLNGSATGIPSFRCGAIVSLEM
jgi:hypothetical protein